MQEKNFEKAALRFLAVSGFWTLKIGWEGFPDRLVFTEHSDRVFWMEMKTAKGRIRKAQGIRAADLRQVGQRVYFVRTFAELVEMVRTETDR